MTDDDDETPGCLWLAALALVAWTALLAHGCGSAVPTFAAAQALCIANERAIIDRQGTTAAEDDAAMAAERARCDAELARLRGR